jgi:hypothetical protein
VLGPALLAFALAAPSQSASDAAATSDLAVSLNRIRAALQKTPALRLALPEPTFRVEVRQHPFFVDVPWTWEFAGGGVPTLSPRPGPIGTPPLGQVDVLPLWRAARKARARRAAEDEVRRALEEFCATHSCEPR